jgi:hypothetical protein
METEGFKITDAKLKRRLRMILIIFLSSVTGVPTILWPLYGSQNNNTIIEGNFYFRTIHNGKIMAIFRY